MVIVVTVEIVEVVTEAEAEVMAEIIGTTGAETTVVEAQTAVNSMIAVNTIDMKDEMTDIARIAQELGAEAEEIMSKSVDKT